MEELYHGSSQIIRKPTFGKGNPENDYGLGFYCTHEQELAMEWACATDNDGFANGYQFETEGLTCLHLNAEGYHILNWLAILLHNRRFDLSSHVSVRARQYILDTFLPDNWLAILLHNRRLDLSSHVSVRARQYILDTFLPDYRDYDLMVGYRADDSYFSFSRAFLANGITLEQLRRAMRLGKLGEQVVLRSPAAFDALSFVKAIPVDASIYHVRRLSRDRDAREDFKKMLTGMPTGNEIYVSTILNEKWSNDDPRL